LEGPARLQPAEHRECSAGSALATIVCYNSGADTARTLARVPHAAERDFDVIVVDDGSTDDTPEHIAPFGFPIIRHPQNRGLGAGIKSGMRYALDHGYAIFCILAGNGKDDPREVPEVLRPIREGWADYVQGSRFAPGGWEENTPAGRLLLIKVHARMMRILTGFRGTDALNGFRAYRTALFAEGGPIDVWQDWLDRYELETYLHFLALRTGRRVTEVGVSKRYPPDERYRRYSHIRPVLDWWRILRPIPLLMLRLKR
jgi:dolichol-phosphate mannosyltransferase